MWAWAWARTFLLARQFRADVAGVAVDLVRGGERASGVAVEWSMMRMLSRKTLEHHHHHHHHKGHIWRTYLAGGGGRNQGQLVSVSHAAAAVSFKTAHPSLEIMASAA